MLVSVSEAAALIGVAESTLRRWDREGKRKLLPACRTKGGHRRYATEDLAAQFFGKVPVENRETIAYARVSSYDQRQDLERQKARLETYCMDQGYSSFTVLADLGSGLTYKKRGLRLLIRKICAGQVSRLILTHRDRLLRFGSDLVFDLCQQFGTQVSVLAAGKPKSFEEELTADVIELMTLFTARMYGKRSHQNVKSFRMGDGAAGSEHRGDPQKTSPQGERGTKKAS